MTDGPKHCQGLRMMAEARLAQLTNNRAPPSLQAVLHELQVHEIELLMQNDELRRTQAALAEAHDRFRDLYELAPLSYITLGRDGCINDVNLTGASLLGMERSRLLGRRFVTAVAVADRDRWHRHMWHVLRHDGRHSCNLELVRPDGTSAFCHVACLRHGDSRGRELRMALTDLGSGHLVETERDLADQATADIGPAPPPAARQVQLRIEDMLAAANLTQSETRVALLIAKGFSTKATARELDVSPATVNIHRKHIRRKLGVERRTDNLYAHLNGLTVAAD